MVIVRIMEKQSCGFYLYIFFIVDFNIIIFDKDFVEDGFLGRMFLFYVFRNGYVLRFNVLNLVSEDEVGICFF